MKFSQINDSGQVLRWQKVKRSLTAVDHHKKLQRQKEAENSANEAAQIFKKTMLKLNFISRL